jgi:hypothetical protein
MTAAIIIAALTSLNNLLMTPPGQVAFTNANDVFMGIFKLLNIHLTANTPAATNPNSATVVTITPVQS